MVIWEENEFTKLKMKYSLPEESGHLSIIINIKNNVRKKEWKDIMPKQLTTEEFNIIISQNRCNYVSIFKHKYPDIYGFINLKYKGKTYGEKLYRHLYNNILDIGKCKNCSLDCKFESVFDGFRKYCSYKCSNSSDDVKKFKKLSYLEKYGVDNPSKSDTIKEKKRITCNEHYGVDCNFSCETTKSKIKKTNLKKYGSKYPLQSNPILSKVRETNQTRYGVNSPLQSEECREKAKQTCIKKYGYEFPLQSNIIHEKLEITNLKKYGTRHYSSSEIYKNKMWSLFYQKLISSNRLKNEIIPLFSLMDYKGTEKKYKFKCLKCSNIFNDHLKDGRVPRCYNCYPKMSTSNGEVDIIKFIRELDNNLIIESGRRFLSSGKELDIYIPSKKVAIEYNGLFWHSENAGGKDSDYHLNKTLECKSKGIRLIHIFEDEWINKKDIVKSRLKNILGYNTNEKIYARKCIVKEISYQECSLFLLSNHIQGKSNSIVNIGLFHNNEIVSAMTFGKLRLSLGNKEKMENHYEMYRFCSSKNVVGGASKLLSYFIKTYNPEKIISYADRRWSNGNLYEKIGFKKVSDGTPNYFYTSDYFTRKYRFGFRKSELYKKLSSFDPSLTEWENMQINGWDRIWDCGSLKYQWINSR